MTAAKLCVPFLAVSAILMAALPRLNLAATTPTDAVAAQSGGGQVEYAKLVCSIRANASATAATATYSWSSPRNTIGGDRHDLVEGETPDALAKKLKTIKSGTLDLMDLLNVIGGQGWVLVQRWRETAGREDVETFMFLRRQ